MDLVFVGAYLILFRFLFRVFVLLPHACFQPPFLVPGWFVGVFSLMRSGLQVHGQSLGGQKHLGTARFQGGQPSMPGWIRLAVACNSCAVSAQRLLLARPNKMRALFRLLAPNDSFS